jgi:hypothetical protein
LTSDSVNKSLCINFGAQYDKKCADIVLLKKSSNKRQPAWF